MTQKQKSDISDKTQIVTKLKNLSINTNTNTKKNFNSNKTNNLNTNTLKTQIVLELKP